MGKVVISKETEVETEIIAHIGNFQGLFKATKIYNQEQAQIRGSKGGGRLRVRRERSNNAKLWQHTQTVKLKSATKVEDNAVANEEYTQTISKQTFGMFMLAAPDMQRKTRFYFPIETIKLNIDGRIVVVELKRSFFEVDVFHKEDGNTSEWCKIDVEHKNIAQELTELGFKDASYETILPVTGLPFAPDKMFMVNKSMLPAQAKLRSFLYEVEWCRSIDRAAVVAQYLTDSTNEEGDQAVQ